MFKEKLHFSPPEEEFLRHFLQISHSGPCHWVACDVCEVCTCSGKWSQKADTWTIHIKNSLLCEIIELVHFSTSKIHAQNTRGIKNAQLKEQGTDLPLNCINFGNYM